MRRRSDIVGSGLVAVADNDETLQRSNRRVINQLRQLILQRGAKLEVS